METTLITSYPSFSSFLLNKEARLTFSWFSWRKKLTGGSQGRLVIARANKRKEKPDAHSFIPKPDEATGLFPEAVLLKKFILMIQDLLLQTKRLNLLWDNSKLFSLY